MGAGCGRRRGTVFLGLLPKTRRMRFLQLLALDLEKLVAASTSSSTAEETWLHSEAAPR